MTFLHYEAELSFVLACLHADNKWRPYIFVLFAGRWIVLIVWDSTQMKQNNGVVILDLLPSHNFSMGKLGLGQQLYIIPLPLLNWALLHHKKAKTKN